MDRDELKVQVESLKFHRDVERLKVSEAIRQLQAFIEENTPDDGLVVTPDKKKNPWTETRKCVVL